MKPLVEVIIEKELKGSPMDGQAKAFVEAGEKYQIDPLFLLAIQSHESRYCRSYSKDANSKRHNCAGIMAWDSNGKRYLKEYGSYKEFIEDHARIIKTGYIDTGRDTVNEIWARYAPSNESMNSSWGPAVSKKYSLLLSEFSI